MESPQCWWTSSGCFRRSGGGAPHGVSRTWLGRCARPDSGHRFGGCCQGPTGEHHYRHRLCGTKTYEILGSGHAGRGFLEESGPSASRGRIDLLKTLKIGIASYGHMKARTTAITRGELTPAQVERNTWFTLIDSIARLVYEHYRQPLELVSRDRPRPLKRLADPAVCVMAESPDEYSRHFSHKASAAVASLALVLPIVLDG